MAFRANRNAALLSIFVGMPLVYSAQSSLEFNQVCENSSHDCIENIEGHLETAPLQSRLWYKLKLLELDALFNLQQFNKLRQEVDLWAEKDGLPITFKVYIQIYRAKLSFGKTSPEITQRYLDEALLTLSNIHEMLPRPMRLIEIANLQLSNNQPEAAKKTLLSLEEKFSHNASPLFNRELYANLGHAAIRLNELDEHVIYREKSLDGAVKVGNIQQMSVAGYNLGRAYQMKSRFDEALTTFKQSASNAKKASDPETRISATMRVIEVTFLKGDKEKARDLFKSIDFQQSTLSKGLKGRYQELNKLLFY